jgi:hypothetical protein
MFLAQVNAEDYGKHCLVSDLLSQHSDDVLSHLAITRDTFVDVYKAVNKVNISMEPAKGDADEDDVLRLRGGAPSNSNQNAASGAGNSNQAPPPIHAPLANRAAAPNAATPAAQPPEYEYESNLFTIYSRRVTIGADITLVFLFHD